jgi:hypothetical protein
VREFRTRAIDATPVQKSSYQSLTIVVINGHYGLSAGTENPTPYN